MRSVSRRSSSPDRMAVVMSVWIRSRRVTGIGTSGGLPPGPSMEVGPSVAMSRVGRSRPSARSALRRSRVLLALRFLALPLHARLLVVLASASLGEDAGLLDLLVEAAEGALERLVLTHSDFCQSGIHLLGPVIVRRSRCRGPTDTRCGPSQGRRSVAQALGRVKRPGNVAAVAQAPPRGLVPTLNSSEFPSSERKT